jgi:ribosomal-protein-alanine N-acetyltransferase
MSRHLEELFLNGKRIGFIEYDHVVDEFQILDVLIDHAYRRKGHAEKAFVDLEKKAKDLQIKKMILEVREDNDAAIKLYEKLNFERSGLRKKYYENKIDAILMQKILAV